MAFTLRWPFITMKFIISKDMCAVFPAVLKLVVFLFFWTINFKNPILSISSGNVC